MGDDAEYSESGVRIYHYEAKEKLFQIAEGDAGALEAIEDHIEKHIGKIETVMHELASDLVHIDVHVVEPTAERNFYTLITSGMSDLPMTVPDGAEEFRFAELLICLPANWDIPKVYDTMTDEGHWWPIRCLKHLARFPHEYDTWLSESHTVPNGDPPEPFAGNTQLCCALLAPPLLFGDGFRSLEISESKTVNFYALLPIYKEEMEFKLKRGGEKLYERFDREGVNELLDINRRNVCHKRFGIF
jgi:Suppressor of fused protein (SUFU)